MTNADMAPEEAHNEGIEHGRKTGIVLFSRSSFAYHTDNRVISTYLRGACSRSPPTTPRAPCSRTARLDMYICGLCGVGGRTPRGYCAARARMRPFCPKCGKT